MHLDYPKHRISRPFKLIFSRKMHGDTNLPCHNLLQQILCSATGLGRSTLGQYKRQYIYIIYPDHIGCCRQAFSLFLCGCLSWSKILPCLFSVGSLWKMLSRRFRLWNLNLAFWNPYFKSCYTSAGAEHPGDPALFFLMPILAQVLLLLSTVGLYREEGGKDQA